MFEVTKQIREALVKEHDVKENSINVIKDGEWEVMFLFFSEHQHQLMQYEFICDQNGRVTLNSSAIAYAPKEKMDAVLKIINERNVWAKFGGAKLYMQPDGEVRSTVDFSGEHSIESIGKVAVGVLASMQSTVNDAYPRLMECIWSEEKEGSNV